MWQKIEDKSRWDKVIGLSAHSRFLQSWSWGKFQESLGRKVLRLSWNSEVFVQAIKMNLPGGFAYWYVPHAPSTVTAEAWDDLVKMLGEHGAIFLRVDPLVELDNKNFRQQIVPSTQPQCTLVMDLSLSSERLLVAMHPKTRYNINLAEKKGVVIRAGTINNFLRLNKQTVRRDKFVSHSDNYYKKMYEILSMSFWREAKGRPIESSEKGMDAIAPQERGSSMTVWQAEFNNKILASALVIYFGDTATYLHGVSANEDRNLMAPYLLHWQIIQDAQKRNFKYYDWWGVNPLEQNHPAYKKSWQGLTRFKRGFGGEVACYPSSFDLIYRPWWYRVYRLSRSLKSLLV